MMADENGVKKRKWMKMILAVCAVVVLLLCHGIHAKKEYIYKKAQEWYDQGEYDKAGDILKDIEGQHYKDADALLYLCRAHVSYDKGQRFDAWCWVEYLPCNFQSETQQKAYLSFRKEVKEAYDAYMDARVEHILSEYDNQASSGVSSVGTTEKSGVPYVGMSESRIGSTTLGAPSSTVRHNNETISGKIYRANLYDFYNGNSIIFIARCVNGTVTEVWDYRNEPIVQKPASTKKEEKAEYDDPYNAEDYSHAEDFYYDHYDDFFDYYDAEDYWNDHHD